MDVRPGARRVRAGRGAEDACGPAPLRRREDGSLREGPREGRGARRGGGRAAPRLHGRASRRVWPRSVGDRVHRHDGPPRRRGGDRRRALGEPPSFSGRRSSQARRPGRAPGADRRRSHRGDSAPPGALRPHARRADARDGARERLRPRDLARRGSREDRSRGLSAGSSRALVVRRPRCRSRGYWQRAGERRGAPAEPLAGGHRAARLRRCGRFSLRGSGERGGLARLVDRAGRTLRGAGLAGALRAHGAHGRGPRPGGAAVPLRERSSGREGGEDPAGPRPRSRGHAVRRRASRAPRGRRRRRMESPRIQGPPGDRGGSTRRRDEHLRPAVHLQCRDGSARLRSRRRRRLRGPAPGGARGRADRGDRGGAARLRTAPHDVVSPVRGARRPRGSHAPRVAGDGPPRPPARRDRGHLAEGDGHLQTRHRAWFEAHRRAPRAR